MFDIAQLEVADTATMHVKGADGEKLFTGSGESKRPVTITFHSPGTKPFVEAETERTNRNIRAQRKKEELTADDLRKSQVDFLAAVTIGMNGLGAGELKGEEMHRAIFANRKAGYIADQSTAFLADWANFTKGSATN